MPRLENWGIMIKDTSYISDDFRVCLYGNVYEHHEFEDGSAIITKKVETFDSTFKLATTMNNVYHLGEIDERFSKRLIDSDMSLSFYDR